ncbi:MAG: ATPase [Chlamydiae bacterium GWC2_50_10]|nr:MAG: ATPase [Chlamydiae bacterium GWC2_50_10]OGN73535.1 MAG: ATPase [Chlamydiae bacterium RIFCSPLOWO2_12_FULL_49_12]
MYPRLLQKPLQGNHSFFLFGPRGTGKTLWLRSRVPTGLYFDLLNQELFFDLLKNTHRLEEMIPKGCKEWIIIDEVQKIPDLLNEVHRLIEKNRYKFILTGSSARTLKRKGVNLLAGRALYYKMFPLTAIELGSDFKIEKSLKYGQLPTIHAQDVKPEDYLHSYIYIYLREEVMQEGLTRNAGAFARFLQVASFSQGSILNITEIAREVSIERKTVEDYFQITEDLLLACRIPPFTKRAKRKTVSHPKFYYFDVGVYRALRPMGPFDVPEEAEGPALESLVLQELQAINSYFAYGYDFYFWRTVDKHEVDFILYGPKGLIGIEVKRSKKIDAADLKSLKAFQSDYPSATLYLFYGGSQRLYFDRIEAIPITEALQLLPKLLEKK